MTISELNEIQKLDNYIAGLEHRRAVTYAKATSATSSEWERVKTKLKNGKIEYASALKGIPRNPGTGDIVGNAAVELAEIRQELRNARKKRKRRVDYIKNVSDKYMRQILILKFIDGYTWEGVAIAIKSKNSGDNVRKMCEQFLSCSKSEKNRGPCA